MQNQQHQDKIQQLLNEYCKKYDIKDQQLIIDNPKYQKYEWYNTFAVYLEINDIETPKEFQYDPLCILKKKQTTAMKIASYGKIPSNHWQHNPLLQNNDKWTVGLFLSYNGIVPPYQWMHDVDITNNKNESIKSNLYKYNYYYIINRFIKLTRYNFNQYVQTEIQNCACQIYFCDREHKFIKTNCNHKICLQCLKEMFKAENYKNCPVCRQSNWFKLINQDQ